LPYFGGSYIQAPFEDITEEQFNEMIKQLHDIDLSKVIEMVDNTARQDELACAAGNCEVA
jgi:ribonucleoside-diphosphate reductase alpha chain